MEKVLSHLMLSHCLPNNVLHTHLTKAQQEVLLGLNMSIGANKLVQSNMSLVNKNALMIVVTLNINEVNTQNVAKVFGLHPRMVRSAKLWQQ
jgi:hypothetical protein